MGFESGSARFVRLVGNRLFLCFFVFFFLPCLAWICSIPSVEGFSRYFVILHYQNWVFLI